MIVSHPFTLDCIAAAGCASVAMVLRPGREGNPLARAATPPGLGDDLMRSARRAASAVRLRREIHRTGPPATAHDFATAGHLDAATATFETSMLPNPPRTDAAIAAMTLRADQRQGCHRLGRHQADANHAVATTALMQREPPGARQIAEAMQALRLELIAISIRAEAAAKPTGENE